jgi:thermitase
MREHQSRWRKRGPCAGVCLGLFIGALGLSAPVAIGAAPNDPEFGKQWADSNLGQLIPTQESKELLGVPLAGTPGADDRALEAWRVTTGSREIVIAETDTGVDYEHLDLSANIWTNPGVEIGACHTSGTHGYNVVAQNCFPKDTESGGYGGHGTHVAGIMGAVGNNGIGVAGMNWQTTILPVKWLDSAGTLTSYRPLIEALNSVASAKESGVNIRVVNDSPVFEGEIAEPVQAELRGAIERLGRENILFVTAAGNTKVDDDTARSSHYPCTYDLPNEICVTASNNNDQIPSWANTGGETVDLAAPGVSIYSTLVENRYGYLSGGSMAAAQVSGAAALILSVAPSLTAEQLKADILNNVDQLPSLAGKVKTGGRLDVCKALPGCEPPLLPPPPPSPPPPVATPPKASSVTVTSKVLKVKRGSTKVGLRCSGATACASKLTLTMRVKRKLGHGTQTSFKIKVLTIGAARFSVGAGGTVQVTIKLNATGRAVVARAHGHLYANLTIFASDPAPPTTQTERVRLVWPTSSPGHRK